MAAAVLALVAALLFTGAAGYISLVEQPVRRTLPAAAMLAQWRASYARALPIQAGLALAGGIAGIVAWVLGGRPEWAFGGMLMIANWPWTLLGIRPVNDRLNALADAEAGEAPALVDRWGRLHAVRTGLGATASAMFVGALA